LNKVQKIPFSFCPISNDLWCTKKYLKICIILPKHSPLEQSILSREIRTHFLKPELPNSSFYDSADNRVPPVAESHRRSQTPENMKFLLLALLQLSNFFLGVRSHAHDIQCFQEASKGNLNSAAEEAKSGN
jgi:hypothetical protein